MLIGVEVRFDRGTLNRPQRLGSALVVEGHAARIHRHGDPLRYTHGDEYRDATELRRIVDTLPGTPVTLGHPPGLIRDGASVRERARIVGRVDAAWLDGDHAAVRMTIAESSARAIEAGTKELSLGYACGLREDGYQSDTKVDHLAIVDKARCGTTCSLRTDARMDCSATCACNEIDPSDATGEGTYTTGDFMADEKKTDKARIDELEGEIRIHVAKIADLEALVATNATAAESAAVAAEKARADEAEAKVQRFDATFRSAVVERIKLERLAIAELGAAVRLDDMTDRQVHEAVVKRLDTSIDVKSVNDDTLRGMFHALTYKSAQNAQSQARVSDIVGRGQASAHHDEATERAKRMDAYRNQWRMSSAVDAQKGAR